MTSLNVGNSVIEPGDFVTAVGVEVDPDYGIPILQVRQAAAGDTILGVAASAMSRGDHRENALTQLGYEMMDGVINQNGYVLVAMEGLVQARLPQASTLKPGAFITAAGAATLSIDNSIAQVMSEADAKGLQWILLNR